MTPNKISTKVDEKEVFCFVLADPGARSRGGFGDEPLWSWTGRGKVLKSTTVYSAPRVIHVVVPRLLLQK